MAKTDDDFTPLDLNDVGAFAPKIVGTDTLSNDDISILHDLERRNKITYNDNYVSEFLKCRNNIFYFIHNYCYIGEVGNPLLYSSNIMNRKYRRAIKSISKFKKAMIMASRQLGKMLDLETNIPLPDGSWCKLKELKVGDIILDELGNKTKIINESPIYINKKCYRLNFDYADSIIAGDEHLWTVSTNIEKNITVNTEELKLLVDNFENLKPYITTAKPIQYKKKKFNLSPYFVGQICYLTDSLVPEEYISGSITQRLMLLRGFFDYGGSCDHEKNIISFSLNKKLYFDKTNLYNTNLYNTIQPQTTLFKPGDCCSEEDILKQIHTVLSSLGIKSKIIENKIICSINSFYLFRDEIKKSMQKKLNCIDCDKHYIKEIVEVDSVPCKCIQVDSPNKLFLCGDSFIPTHNSTLAACLIAHTITFFPGIRTVLFNMDQGAGIENIDKLKFVLSNLPDWMKFLPDKFTKKTYVELTNGSKASVFYPSTIKSPDQIARSLTIPCLYVDEGAFIPHIERIWMSAQPTLSTASMQAEKYGYPSWSVLTSTVRHV